jgi:hypothetical protein
MKMTFFRMTQDALKMTLFLGHLPNIKPGKLRLRTLKKIQNP